MSKKRLNAFNWSVVMSSIILSILTFFITIMQDTNILLNILFTTFLIITVSGSCIGFSLNIEDFFTPEEKTDELLAEHARIMNQFGSDSDEANKFVEKNSHDKEFVRLAALAKQLKKAFGVKISD